MISVVPDAKLESWFAFAHCLLAARVCEELLLSLLDGHVPLRARAYNAIQSHSEFVETTQFCIQEATTSTYICISVIQWKFY